MQCPQELSLGADAQGHLSVNYSDNYYLLSQRFPEVPRLTAAHYEAMSLFNQLASSQELALQMLLQPGDIQLLNNHTCLHYRSAFVDWPVRHLSSDLCRRHHRCLKDGPAGYGFLTPGLACVIKSFQRLRSCARYPLEDSLSQGCRMAFVWMGFQG